MSILVPSKRTPPPKLPPLPKLRICYINLQDVDISEQKDDKYENKINYVAHQLMYCHGVFVSEIVHNPNGNEFLQRLLEIFPNLNYFSQRFTNNCPDCHVIYFFTREKNLFTCPENDHCGHIKSPAFQENILRMLPIKYTPLDMLLVGIHMYRPKSGFLTKRRRFISALNQYLKQYIKTNCAVIGDFNMHFKTYIKFDSIRPNFVPLIPENNERIDFCLVTESLELMNPFVTYDDDIVHRYNTTDHPAITLTIPATQ